MRPISEICVLGPLNGEKDLATTFHRVIGERRPEVARRCPLLPFDESGVTEAGIASFLQSLNLRQGALVVGFELGGLVAARMQELRPDLEVFSIHAPTAAGEVRVGGRMERRWALYCTDFGHRRGGEDWGQYAEAFDVRWVYIQHMVAGVVSGYVSGETVADEVARRTRYLDDGARPRGPVPAVYLLHGKGGSPEGSVLRMERVLTTHWPGMEFRRPLLPHNDPAAPAERSVEYLRGLEIPQGSLLIGISLGAIVAAAFQEQERADLQCFAINGPTWADGLRLERWMANRVAVYSLGDVVVAGRVAEWPRLAQAYEFAWLGHDTDPHLKYLVRLVDWYLEGRLAITADRVLDVPRTKQEAGAEGK